MINVDIVVIIIKIFMFNVLLVIVFLIFFLVLKNLFNIKDNVYNMISGVGIMLLVFGIIVKFNMMVIIKSRIDVIMNISLIFNLVNIFFI